jgi:Protein of unknown function, DUF481
MHKPFLHAALASAFFTLAGVFAHADIIETKSGARLLGSITKVDAGLITLATDYAGTLTIKQTEVVKFETEKPLFIRLVGGTTMEGIVSVASSGQVNIKGKDGTITTSVDKISRTWAPGEMDPAVALMIRKWKYEIALDIAGKTGNSEQLGYGGSAKATLAGPQDTLIFYAAFNNRETDGVSSSDNAKVGLDYSRYLSEHVTWYTRDEGGYDNIKDIEFYNIAAAGLGYDFIKNLPRQKLTGRGGLSYRFEQYGGNTTTDETRSAGLDLGLNHNFQFENAVMSNSITYVPSFEDFSNFRALHDSHIEFPLVGSWKFRVGVQNDYSSVVPADRAKLDTTYYGKFVFGWE